MEKYLQSSALSNQWTEYRVEVEFAVDYKACVLQI